MAGGSVKSNPTKARKRVEASQESGAPSLVRGRDGSAFARCEECDKDVPVALISFHSCSLDAKIKMNLEAQVVEKASETNKPTEKKKFSSTEPKAKKAKVEKGKKGKDLNKPKRPLTAFFLFMSDFRKEYKEAHPDSKDVKAVAKEGGEKWKSMSDEEKKLYQDKATELKAEYQKALEVVGAEDAEEEAGSEKDGAEKEEQEVEEVSDGE